MSNDTTMTTVELNKLDRGLLWIALIAFLAVLGAYVGLAIASEKDPDPEGVVRMVVTIAGLFGLGVVQRVTARAQHRQIEKQNEKLDRITDQTNGVLDARIKNGSKAALLEVLQERLDEGAETTETTGSADVLGKRGFPL